MTDVPVHRFVSDMFTTF